MKLVILGAGMSGLIAANMLRRFNPIIWEAQNSLPNNHSALLRFRSEAVANATGIPFRKVNITKGIHAHSIYETQIQQNNRYSYKVSRGYSNRSIINLEGGVRWIAPNNFVELAARSCNIEYGRSFCKQNYNPLYTFISTIPLQSMLFMYDVESKFQIGMDYLPIWAVTADLMDVDLHQTLYFPNHQERFYRASITGNKLIVEYTQSPVNVSADIEQALNAFGIATNYNCQDCTRREYGKLIPATNEQARRAAVIALTEHFGIYSLGRFATWRQILLDDVVKDVQRIEGWIERGDYARRLEAK